MIYFHPTRYKTGWKQELLLLENKSQWQLTIQPETDQTLTHKNMDSSRFSFSFLSFFFFPLLKQCGKRHMLPPKCSITKHRNCKFSDPLVASIRHATGSKVRTATLSTFTHGGGSFTAVLICWNALRLSREKCKDRNGENCLTSMQT